MNFIPTGHKALKSAPNNVAEIGIRPEHLSHTTKAKAKLNGSLRHIEQLGEYALAYIDLGGDIEITAKLEGESGLQHGADMPLTFDTDKLHHFDGNGVSLATSTAHT